jgi:hypothetical protein
MDIKQLLLQKKTGIVRKWFRLITDTYKPQTSEFLRKKLNRFANPVGSTTGAALEEIFDNLINGDSAESAAKNLDPIIRIRALQDFTPSESVKFVFELKGLLRKAFKQELKKDDPESAVKAVELYRLEDLIDQYGLKAFDIYMTCRETVHRLKENEYQRAGLEPLVGIDRDLSDNLPNTSNSESKT